MKSKQNNFYTQTQAETGNGFIDFNNIHNYGASTTIPPTEVDSYSSIPATEPDEGEVTQVEENFGYTAGWLICIEGPQKGMDFRLRMGGYNHIGRGGAYEIELKDPKVSRDFKMWLCYDSEDNQYLVGAKSSGNLVRINGTMLPPESPRVLNRNDKIRVGNTVLMFIPLCDDQFVWSEKG